MANLIYGTTDRTQGILTYSTSATNTNYEITVKSDLQAKNYYLSGYRLNTIINGVTEATATAYVSTLTTSFTTFLSTTQVVKTYAKGRTAQTITVGSSYAGENVSGYLPGNKSGSSTVNITIPAKPSYTVSYNANGGAGAPSNQKKWYGETLQITSTRPTRASYNFLGWATSSGSNTVAYTSGANYTANAAITLYAVWQLAYTPPKITGYGASLPTIYRADSSGNAQDEGTYAYVSFSWSTFSSAYQGQSAKVDYKLTTSSTWENAITKVISGTSGNFEETIGGSLDIDSAYDFRITVIDSRSSSNFKTFLSSAFFPMDFGYGGKAIGIGTTAPDPTGHDEGLLKIKMDLQFEDPTQARNAINAAPKRYIEASSTILSTDNAVDDFLLEQYSQLEYLGSRWVFIIVDTGLQLQGSWLVQINKRTSTAGSIIAYSDDENGYRECSRSIYGGALQPWEWVNPPCQIGTEYRTTQRWRGLPVYTKLIDCGGVRSGRKTVSINTGASQIIKYSGQYKTAGATAWGVPFSSPASFPTYFIDLGVQQSTIYIDAGSNFGLEDVGELYVQLYYTK